MADNTVVHGAPGIAGYDSETWGNVRELRLQDTPPTAVQRTTITAGGSPVTLPIFSVVSATGLATSAAGVSNAIGILPCPLYIPASSSVEIDLIVAGHYDYKALNFDASFTTDALKRAAFAGRPAPVNIILDTNKYDSDGVLA